MCFKPVSCYVEGAWQVDRWRKSRSWCHKIVQNTNILFWACEIYCPSHLPAAAQQSHSHLPCQECWLPLTSPLVPFGPILVQCLVHILLSYVLGLWESCVFSLFKYCSVVTSFDLPRLAFGCLTNFRESSSPFDQVSFTFS